MEALGVTVPKVMLTSNDERRAQEILQSTTIRLGNQFQTGLLWRYDRFELPDSYLMALIRLECLNRKMAREPEIARVLDEKIRQYVEKGYARKLTDAELREDHPKTWYLYLPIFVVINPR